MRLAYLHDHRYLVSSGRVYSTGTMNDAVFLRFLDGFDEIWVFSRLEDVCEETDMSKYNEITLSNVKFFNTVNDFMGGYIYTGGKSGVVSRIKECNAAIARVPGVSAVTLSLLAHRSGMRVGLEVVGCAFDAYWNYGKLSAKLIAPVELARMRKIVKKATHVCYVTEKFLQARYPTCGASINASNVVLEKRDGLVLEKRLKKIRGLERGSDFHIGIIGSWNVEYKGHDVLLAAIAKMSGDKSKIKVYFVGDGDFSKAYSLATKFGMTSAVKPVGRLKPGVEVNDFIESIDLLVHPSKQEGLPRVVIESLNLCCPVLASSVAGIPELLDKKRLHSPGDYRALSVQMDYVVNNMEVLEEMAIENCHAADRYQFTSLESKRRSLWADFSRSIEGIV